MIDRLVLQGLAAGVAAGDVAAAYAALARVDWIVRGFARRKLARAVAMAERETGERCGGEPEVTRHVLKAAALAIAHSFYVATNRTSVAVEYDALPRRAARRWWIATAGTAVVLAGAAALTISLVLRPPPSRAAHGEASATLAPPPPPSATAFRDGGRPLTDDAITRVLREDLAPLITLVDHDRRTGEHSTARRAFTARLAASPAFAAHGEPLARAWAAMLAALDHWVDLPTVGAEAKAGADQLARAANALTDAFIAAELGYYLEPRVLDGGGDLHGVVIAYGIEDVSFVHADGAPRRVLSLRRLDNLNYARSLLGQELAQHGGALLLLDQIEHRVATKILPVLGARAPYALGDPDWAAQADHAELAAAAGDAIRRELLRALGDDGDAAAHLGDLIAQRTAFLAGVQAKLAGRWVVAPIETPLFPPELLSWLRGKVPEAQHARAVALNDALVAAGAPRIAARLRQLLVATVRRHEVQHDLDDVPAHPRRYPAALAAVLGPLTSRTGEPYLLPASARTELSAYLSQIANDPVTPQLPYWDLADHALASTDWGSAESYVAVVASAALARALRLPTTAPLIHDHQIDRDQLAVIARAIATQSDDALRAAAAAAWRELFDAPVARIVDLPASTFATGSGNVAR